MIKICGESIAFAAELQTDTQYLALCAGLVCLRPVAKECVRRGLSLLFRLIQDVLYNILTRARQNID